MGLGFEFQASKSAVDQEANRGTSPNREGTAIFILFGST
jgi:hypothetical protein